MGMETELDLVGRWIGNMTLSQCTNCAFLCEYSEEKWTERAALNRWNPATLLFIAERLCKHTSLLSLFLFSWLRFILSLFSPFPYASKFYAVIPIVSHPARTILSTYISMPGEAFEFNEQHSWMINKKTNTNHSNSRDGMCAKLRQQQSTQQQMDSVLLTCSPAIRAGSIHRILWAEWMYLEEEETKNQAPMAY